ncbi:MAG: proton-conducting transporter membrane subunit [Kangiellaceae bacterium]|jgi:multicomponent Na+:H+ antiporter subunit D|nr:proton-conducting transporter membrane subunit [Kangiellaceae bacterium]
MMSSHLPILLFLLPFFAGVAMPILAAKNKNLCQPVTFVTLIGMVVVAILNMQMVSSNGPIEYAFGGWTAPLGIAWLNDALAAMMALTVSVIAFFSIVYNRTLVSSDLAQSGSYYSLILIMLSGLVGIVFAADLFNVFVFLEVAALTGYALVGASGGKALVFAFRYLLLGSFGATLYLLGLSHIYVATGTLNMADLAQRIPDLITSTAVAGGLIYMFLGLSIKMALIPLHSWLPDAYSTAPSSVAPLLASTITKVALVVWVRIEYSLIAPNLEVAHVPVLVLLEELGVIAALVGGALALIQTDLKRMFAYGGVGHIGLILIGVSLGNDTGFTGGVFYLINDAVMQASLFMIAGAVLFYHKAGSLAAIRGVGHSASPWITGSLVVVAIGMIGLPPTGGFFGKWNIILGALEAEHYLAAFAVVASTLFTMAYFVKIFAAWFQPLQEQDETTENKDIAASLKLSLGSVSVVMIGLGLMSDSVVQYLLTSYSRFAS